MKRATPACPAVLSGIHAFAWRGAIPCTGAWACIYCGAPEVDSFDGRPDDPHGWNRPPLPAPRPERDEHHPWYHGRAEYGRSP